MGAKQKKRRRGPDLSRPRPIGKIPPTNRHRRVPVAADPGNRGHIPRPHIRHDATRIDADKRRARQTCNRGGPDRRPRFRTAILRRAGRVVPRTPAAGQPAVGAPQSNHHAACRSAADRCATGDGDRREYPKPRGRNRPLAGNRQSDRILASPPDRLHRLHPQRRPQPRRHGPERRVGQDAAVAFPRPPGFRQIDENARPSRHDADAVG